MGATRFLVVLRLERRATLGAFDLGFDDPQGSSIAPLTLAIVR
jgi:hypothetical protein